MFRRPLTLARLAAFVRYAGGPLYWIVGLGIAAIALWEWAHGRRFL